MALKLVLLSSNAIEKMEEKIYEPFNNKVKKNPLNYLSIKSNP